MRRIIGVFVLTACAVLLFAASGPVFAETAPPPQSQPEVEQATVVRVVVKRPPRVIHRRAKLAVPEHPGPAQVQQIINYEAALWGVSAAGLSHRAYCESKYEWWAVNGQYVGVLQFGPNAFYRGLASIRTRKIVQTSTRVRRMRSRVYRHWSDGHVTRNSGRTVRQSVVTRRVGYLPKQPSMTNAWVQIRIGAQALRGISAVHSSEWSCGA